MGLAIAAQFASAGAQVTGADIDARLVNAINDGTLDVADEPGLPAALDGARAAGTLTATTDTTAAVRDADAVLVLVRLVADTDGSPDYRNIDAATEAIGRGLHPGVVVSYETTLPVGDTRNRFGRRLEELSGLVAGRDFHLCFSPERVSSGHIFQDLATYPKIVAGVTPASAEVGRRLYEQHLPAAVWVVSSLETAEMVKIAETTFRDVNIALANEFARYADTVGIAMDEVARAANSQPYSMIHQSGPGVGGHCIPVYPHFFMARAGDSRLVSTARQINREMPAYTVDRLAALLGDISGRRVLLLGLAYRGDVPETSHSVAWDLIKELHARRADVRVHDPVVGREFVESQGLQWSSPGDRWAEALLLQAAHAEYRTLTPQSVNGVIAVLDGRAALDSEAWQASGIAYARIGG